VTEQEAAYIANALAEGKHMTEGSIAEMTAEPPVEIPREVLEAAVLVMWDDLTGGQCRLCFGYHSTGVWYDASKVEHAPNCIVPALLAKHT
jgi:hypothetical protein